jgi:hypothetical protein
MHLHEVKRLMRAVLDTRLGGRPLESRNLFRRRSGAGSKGDAEETMDAMISTGSET